MKNKYLVLLFLLIVSVQGSKAQLATLSFAEVDRLQQMEARPIVVFISTEWCRYCQKMKHSTFQVPTVVDLLEQHYYFVELNAEDTRSIRFGGHDFHFRPTGTNTGIHELAEALATIDGQVAYPSLCILNEQHEIVFQYQQFLSASEMEVVLEAVLIEKTR